MEFNPDDFKLNLGEEVKIKGPCGKEVSVMVSFGSASCSKCGNICRFDYIKTKYPQN